MSDGFTVDVSSLVQLAKVCHIVERSLEKELLAGIAAGGEIIAAQARRNAENIPRKGTGTNRIRNSIKVKRRGVVVKIQAGGDSAPEGAPINNAGKGGTFRHPVFGNRFAWVQQPSFPYLGIDETTAALAAAQLDKATETALKGLSVV